MGNIHVQPATVFVNRLWGYNIVRLMLSPGWATTTIATTVTGTVGRGIAQPTGGRIQDCDRDSRHRRELVLCRQRTGRGHTRFLDLADDNFDHTGKNYIGGSRMMVGNYIGSGPGNLAIAGSASAGNIGRQVQGEPGEQIPRHEADVSAVARLGMVPADDKQFRSTSTLTTSTSSVTLAPDRPWTQSRTGPTVPTTRQPRTRRY